MTPDTEVEAQNFWLYVSGPDGMSWRAVSHIPQQARSAEEACTLFMGQQGLQFARGTLVAVCTAQVLPAHAPSHFHYQRTVA